MDVIVIDTPQLGDRSYLVHDGTVGLVIDPQRDTDRVEAAARDAGVTITHVAETHLHNDYLTGGSGARQGPRCELPGERRRRGAVRARGHHRRPGCPGRDP